MQEFLETPPFPGCLSFGYRSEPQYSTTIVKYKGGQTDRIRNWVYPLQVITCTCGPRLEEQVQAALDFYHAMGGEECGFRFKDHTDYKSCHVGKEPTAVDAPLVYDDLTSEGYQLFKKYVAGVRTQYRKIVKPVAGTIRVANQAGVEQASNLWTIDYTTGILVPEIGFSGTPTTWGGEFDLPVCFEGGFPVEIVNKQIESVAMVLSEIRL